jgi:hypothetical protein
MTSDQITLGVASKLIKAQDFEKHKKKGLQHSASFPSFSVLAQTGKKRAPLEIKCKTNLPLNLMLTQAKFSNQYQGILVKVGGRLRGVQRAKRLQLSYGGISAQTARSFLLSNKTQIFTK